MNQPPSFARQCFFALGAVLWPLRAPLGTDPARGATRIWWSVCSALLVLPLTAVLHHAIFFRPNCMLNPFNGEDYTWEVVQQWLSKDPSPYVALVIAACIFAAGLRWRIVRLLTAPVFLALLPLTIWIWDIPFSGRFICLNFHDARTFPLIGQLKTRRLYQLGLLAYLALLLAIYLRSGKSNGMDQSESSAPRVA